MTYTLFYSSKTVHWNLQMTTTLITKWPLTDSWNCILLCITVNYPQVSKTWSIHNCIKDRMKENVFKIINLQMYLQKIKIMKLKLKMGTAQHISWLRTVTVLILRGVHGVCNRRIYLVTHKTLTFWNSQSTTRSQQILCYVINK